jgi:hypothetical protein
VTVKIKLDLWSIQGLTATLDGSEVIDFEVGENLVLSQNIQPDPEGPITRLPWARITVVEVIP